MSNSPHFDFKKQKTIKNVEQFQIDKSKKKLNRL